MTLAAILLLSAVVSYQFFSWYQEDVTQTLGLRLVERNVLYEKSRLLTLISKEIALTQKMASSPVLKRWIASEYDPGARSAALVELEDYRNFFHGRRYFFAMEHSGNYYFKEDGSTEPGELPRYTLRKDVLKDGWFYAVLAKVKDVQLNVETDYHIQKTLLWINAVVHNEQQRPVAVVGTGLELSQVLRSVEASNADTEGENILIDEAGAIQLHSNLRLIDFASIRKHQTGEAQSTVFDLISNPADRNSLRKLMAELKLGKRATASWSVHLGRKTQMVALAWVPEIQWFVVSIIAPSAAMSSAHFPSGVLLVVGIFIVALTASAVWFDRGLLRRLVRLDKAAQSVAKGNFAVQLEDRSEDEIGRVTNTFLAMSKRIETYTDDLRRQVAERTAELQEKNIELETLSMTDSLTGLANRMRLDALLRAQLTWCESRQACFSVILIDIDKFKSVNDTYGHQTGDAVLIQLSGLFERHMRAHDVVGRWGGEEFLVICIGANNNEALSIAERLRQAMAAYEIDVTGPKTGSFGVSTYEPGSSMQSMIGRADIALYRAKEAGRNRVETY